MTESHSAVILPASDPVALLVAARMLRDGCVLAIPTDTVYGLAASIFRAEAIERIFRIKQRPPAAAVPILLATAADLPLLVREIPLPAWSLINEFWPGSLTIVLAARSSVSRSITGGTGTVAARVPGARTTLELLATVGEPLIGTSANVHSQSPCLTADEVSANLGSLLDGVIVDDTVIRSGQPSTVVELRGDECLIHRLGGISAGDLRRVVGLRVRVLSMS